MKTFLVCRGPSIQAREGRQGSQGMHDGQLLYLNENVLVCRVREPRKGSKASKPFPSVIKIFPSVTKAFPLVVSNNNSFSHCQIVLSEIISLLSLLLYLYLNENVLASRPIRAHVTCGPIREWHVDQSEELYLNENVLVCVPFTTIQLASDLEVRNITLKVTMFHGCYR